MGAKKSHPLADKHSLSLNQYLVHKLMAKPSHVHEKELSVFPRLILNQLLDLVTYIRKLVELFEKTYMEEVQANPKSLQESTLKTSKLFGSTRNKVVDQYLELKVD